MNIGVLVLAFLTVTGTVTYLYTSSNAAQKEEQMFRNWMKDNGKQYTTVSEYQQRLTNFRGNLKRNQEMTSEHPQATFGLNKFSDMSHQEFKDSWLMKPFQVNNTCIWPYHRIAKVDRTVAIPTTFDWRTKGAVSPVKNQQSCGSCWTFSTAENIEGQWFLSGHTLPSLSEQWIVDCSHGCLQSEPDLCNGGCGGGLPWLAYEDIIKNGGLTDEAHDPYVGEQTSCPASDPSIAKISNWTALDDNPTDIITFLVKQGPLSITLNADLLFSYSGGVISGDPSTCPNSQSDHAVLLVGYDNTQSPPFWIIKNSWGADWGEQGYFRMESDNGLCGINSCVTSALP